MLRTLGPYETYGSGHMDSAEIGAVWATEYPLQVLGGRVLLKNPFSAPGSFHGVTERAKKLVEKRGAQRWPHPSSVFIEDDMIVVNM